jgi:hypothetical protein
MQVIVGMSFCRGTALWGCALVLFLAQCALCETIECEVTGEGVLDCGGVEYKKEALDVPGTSIFYWHLAMCIGFVCFAGMHALLVAMRLRFL